MVMTPEEQAAATAKAEAEKAEKDKADAAAATAKAEEEAKANQNKEIDFKAELAKEKAAKEKAEKELAARRFKEAEDKRRADEGADDDGDKPVTSKDLAALENRLYQKAQKELHATRITEIAQSLSKSEDEAALLVETHKNRTFPPDLSIEGQMQEVYAIIHGRQMAAKAAELARALRSKDTAGRVAVTEHRDAPTADEPRLNSAEAVALKDAGMTWDPNRSAYKKPISNGKRTYFFDPKSRKRWTE